MDTQYRFTVSAANVCGKGKESKSSNILFVEAVLPNGWFRTKQSKEVRGHVDRSLSRQLSSSALLTGSAHHRLSTSEAANPLTNMPCLTFIYYNLHTGQASVHRPETDSYFLENIRVTDLFNAKEVAKLREIYDEEMLHYDKVSVERMGYILLECGERVHPNRIKAVIGEVSFTEHFLKSFQEFMDVMYTFKMRALSMR